MTPRFRLGIAQALSLVLAAQVAVTVLAMAVAIAFSLGHGFSVYLRARDAQLLSAFADLCARSMTGPGWDGGRRPVADDYRQMLHRFALDRGVQPLPSMGAPLPRLGRRPPPPGGAANFPPPPGGAAPFPPPPESGAFGWPPPPPSDDPLAARPPAPGPAQAAGEGDAMPGDAMPGDATAAGATRRGGPPRFGPPGLGAPPPGAVTRPIGPPDDFGPRVAVFDTAGTFLFGLRQTIGPDTLTEKLRLGGQQIATLALAPAPAPAGVEAVFLRDQYTRIATVAAILLAAAIAAGAGLAASWARPLRAIRQTTAQIACGDFAARLPEAGALEIAMTIRNINDMAAALQALEQTRRSWLAQISHELRTPLTVLRGELEALADGVRTLDDAAITSLREEAAALAALVEDLHLLSMSDLGRLPCHFDTVDPATLLHRAAERFAAEAAAKGLALTCEAPHEAASARWDARRISQILANLLANSLRYTDAPGRIRLCLTTEPGWVTLHVEDSAPGVPPDHLARLLEPFYRVDAARSRDQGGSGLGLAVCTAIAAAHGGELRLAASALGGLSASLRLPRTPPTA